MHFAHSDEDDLGEDHMTVAYLQETARAGGAGDASRCSIEDIGWDRRPAASSTSRLRFDRSLFKLYPWEWLAADDVRPVGPGTLDNGGGTGSTLWIEPAWKMLLSNKALLAILWELFPATRTCCPPTSTGRASWRTPGYVAKPLLGREGAGRHPARAGSPSRCCGVTERLLLPGVDPLPDFDGNRAVLGAWVVDGESAGLGIRETAGRSPTSTPALCRM